LAARVFSERWLSVVWIRSRSSCGATRESAARRERPRQRPRTPRGAGAAKLPLKACAARHAARCCAQRVTRRAAGAARLLKQRPGGGGQPVGRQLILERAQLAPQRSQRAGLHAAGARDRRRARRALRRREKKMAGFVPMGRAPQK
jgi:hypothetical protein